MNLTQQELNTYSEYHRRADKFLDKTICAEDLLDHQDYVPGSKRVAYYHQKLSQTDDVYIEEFNARDYAFETFNNREYEFSIIERLNDISDRNNVLITIGSLGSGKSTCVKEIERILKQRLEEYTPQDQVLQFIPLVVPCIQIKSLNAELHLLEALLVSILSRIIRSRLKDHNLIKDQTKSSLLQCLILIDSVRTWAFTHSLHIFPQTTKPSPLSELPPQNILNALENPGILGEKLTQLESFTIKIQDYYTDLLKDRESAKDAASCALGLLDALTTVPKSLPKVVIVDNLDQLPTKTIQQIVDSLYSISAVNKNVKFLVPLRPSSLGVNSYTQNITYVYHKGPCTYYLIYHRLVRYILSRSTKDLRVQNSSIESPHCKTEQEVSALVSIAYIYACLMFSGAKKVDPNKAVIQVRKEVHSDHEQLVKKINLPSGTVKAVSEMIGAIVGLSGRYAVAQFSQFVADLYYSPEILKSIFVAQNGQGRVTISYKRLVNTLFFSKNRKLTLGRYLNLFRPVESNNNPRRPSLVKLRILSHIEEDSSMSLSVLTRSLAAYGVPTEIAIRCLNSLHDERRRLVWFSSNQTIQGNKYDEHECAVVSEQGIRYFNGLVQAFDYLWVCAAQIRGETNEDPVFPVKLSRYIFLIRELLDIELKQNAFFICGDHESVSPTGTPHDHITLRLLLRSIPQAVKSSKIAFAVSDSGTKYVQNLADYLVLVVQLLRQAIVEYSYCFGASYYVVHYRKELDDSTQALKELLSSGEKDLSEEHQEKISSGIDFLIQEIEEYDKYDALLIKRPVSPDLDFVTETARLTRFVLPEKKLRQIDGLELDNVAKSALIEKQDVLAQTLASRIPRFQELSAQLSSITDQLTVCIKTSEQLGVATGKHTYEWLKKEQEWWNEVIQRLEETRYTAGGQELSCSGADLIKSHFNSRIKLLCRLCIELDASPPLDLQRSMWA